MLVSRSKRLTALGRTRPSVYFVQQARSNGLVKIGTSVNVPKRIRELQSITAEELRLLVVVWGGFSIEASLHNHFESFWVRGEWFRPGPPVLDLVKALQRLPVDTRPTLPARKLGHVARECGMQPGSLLRY